MSACARVLRVAASRYETARVGTLRIASGGALSVVEALDAETFARVVPLPERIQPQSQTDSPIINSPRPRPPQSVNWSLTIDGQPAPSTTGRLGHVTFTARFESPGHLKIKLQRLPPADRVQDSLSVRRSAVTRNDSSGSVIFGVTPGSSESLITGTLYSEVADDAQIQIITQVSRWSHNEVDENGVTHLEQTDRHHAVVHVDGLREPEDADEVEEGKVILRLSRPISNARRISVAAHVELVEQPGDRRQDPEKPNATILGEQNEAQVRIALEGEPGVWFRLHITLSLETLREM